MASVFAKIDQNGNTVYSGPGNSGQVSSSRLDIGRYRVEFTPSLPPGGPQGAPPVVVATVMTEEMNCDQSGANCSISITDVSNSHVCFAIRAASDCLTLMDCPFNFIAEAPAFNQS